MITKKYRYRVLVVITCAILGLTLGALSLVSILFSTYSVIEGIILGIFSIILIGVSRALIIATHSHCRTRRLQKERERRLDNIKAMEEVNDEHLDGV